MEPSASFPCSEEITTYSDPKPEESSSRLAIIVLLRHSLMSSDLRLGLPSVFFFSGFLTWSLRTFLLAPMRATRANHLDFLHMVILIIPDEEHNSRCFLLYSFSGLLFLIRRTIIFLFSTSLRFNLFA